MGNIKDLDDVSSCEDFSKEINNLNNSIKGRLNADPEGVQQGLAKLVLTLIQLLRKLMEKQAMRRIENETLTDEEIEKLGEAFIKLEEKMIELMEVFELCEEDLNLNLGPLGDLM